MRVRATTNAIIGAGIDAAFQITKVRVAPENEL